MNRGGLKDGILKVRILLLDTKNALSSLNEEDLNAAIPFLLWI